MRLLRFIASVSAFRFRARGRPTTARKSSFLFDLCCSAFDEARAFSHTDAKPGQRMTASKAHAPSFRQGQAAFFPTSRRGSISELVGRPRLRDLPALCSPRNHSFDLPTGTHKSNPQQTQPQDPQTAPQNAGNLQQSARASPSLRHPATRPT